MAKMGGGHHGKNGWKSLWQKWVEVTMAKTGENGVRETVAKRGGAHCGKNGWKSLWQKWVEVTMAKTGENGVRETVA